MYQDVLLSTQDFRCNHSCYTDETSHPAMTHIWDTRLALVSALGFHDEFPLRNADIFSGFPFQSFSCTCSNTLPYLPPERTKLILVKTEYKIKSKEKRHTYFAFKKYIC